jgi:hypothetical protein
MKTYGGVDIQTQVSLTSALVVGEWSASHPGRFIPGDKSPGIHWIGSWVAPRASLDDVEKILGPTGTQTTTPRSSSPQPVAIPTELSRLSNLLCCMLKFSSGFVYLPFVELDISTGITFIFRNVVETYTLTNYSSGNGQCPARIGIPDCSFRSMRSESLEKWRADPLV